LGFGTTELHVLRPGSLIDRHFLYYLTISGVFRGFGATQMYGTAGQKRISDGFLNNFPTPLPPFEEQK
jgi:type I restriction enzyme S subunit